MLTELKKNIIVDDNHILLNQSTYIPKNNKYVEIRQINYWYQWESFVYYLGIFLKYYYIICENAKLPDKLSDIENFRNNIQFAIGTNKIIMKYLVKICGYTYLWNDKKNKYVSAKSFWAIKWMKKNFSVDDWIEIFVCVYLYNIKGVKKNLYEGLLLLSKAQLN